MNFKSYAISVVLKLTINQRVVSRGLKWSNFCTNTPHSGATARGLIGPVSLTPCSFRIPSLALVVRAKRDKRRRKGYIVFDFTGAY